MVANQAPFHIVRQTVIDDLETKADAYQAAALRVNESGPGAFGHKQRRLTRAARRLDQAIGALTLMLDERVSYLRRQGSHSKVVVRLRVPKDAYAELIDAAIRVRLPFTGNSAQLITAVRKVIAESRAASQDLTARVTTAPAPTPRPLASPAPAPTPITAETPPQTVQRRLKIRALIPTTVLSDETVEGLRERLTGTYGSPYSNISSITPSGRNDAAAAMRNEVISSESLRPLSLILAHLGISNNFTKGVGGTDRSLAERAARRASAFNYALQLLGVAELTAENAEQSRFRDYLLSDLAAPANLLALHALGMEAFLRSFATTPMGTKERVAVRNRTGTTLVQQPILDVLNAGRLALGDVESWTMESPEFLALLPEPLRPQSLDIDQIRLGSDDFDIPSAGLGS